MPNQPGDSEAQIFHVAVKPPPFWKTNPALWFHRLEAQFSLAKIACETTKFNHVVAAVDADVLISVSDIITNPPSHDPYTELKKRLIQTHAESETANIRKLLQGLELGDQRPSQLLSRMRALAGSTSVGEPLLKSLWLGRLPHNTQSILAALNQDLSQLAQIADKIHEFACEPTINAASTAKLDSNKLEHQIAQLTQQVSELTSLVHKQASTANRPRHQHYRQRSRSRDRSRQYRDATDGLCFYHTNFGHNAKKCKQPCSFGRSEN